MPFSDFQKTWKVTKGSTGESVEHEVKISIKIECLNQPEHNIFGCAIYNEDENRIEGSNYTITFEPGTPGAQGTLDHITCRYKLGSTATGPGSWTADDSSGDGGDGGDEPEQR